MKRIQNSFSQMQWQSTLRMSLITCTIQSIQNLTPLSHDPRNILALNFPHSFWMVLPFLSCIHIMDNPCVHLKRHIYNKMWHYSLLNETNITIEKWLKNIYTRFCLFQVYQRQTFYTWNAINLSWTCSTSVKPTIQKIKNREKK